MKLISKEEAEEKTLAITSEGMHFKGQFLPIESYNILGKQVKIIEKAFRFVYCIEYENERYFISEELFLTKL